MYIGQFPIFLLAVTHGLASLFWADPCHVQPCKIWRDDSLLYCDQPSTIESLTKFEYGKKMVIRSKSCVLSPQLQKFLGPSQMLRYEVLNQLWDYVAQHDLIGPNDKQIILCDYRFQGLFGVDSFTICQMNTLSKHLSF